MEADSKRYDNIDILKCIAIFEVIVIHCFSIKMDFWETGNLSNYILYFFRTFLTISVPIFFVCNGFLLFRQELNWKKHIKKTIKMFVLTYIWGVVTIVSVMWIKGVRIPVGDIINMFRDWQLGWINHLWFMGALTRIYIAFPILKLASEKRKEALIYITFIILIITTINKGLDIVALIETDNRWLKSMEIFDPFQDIYDWTYVYFGIGGIFSLYRERIAECFRKHRKRSNVLCVSMIMVNSILLFACGVFISSTIGKHWDVVWDGYNMLFTLGTVCAIYMLSLNYRGMKLRIATKIVKIVSSNTLGIYFIHMIFIHIWNECVGNYLPLGNLVTIIGCSICTFMISTIVVVAMKKIPVVKLLIK